MELTSQILLITHIITGSISLILFWIPIFTRKGGKAHSQVGKVYVVGMWITVITAAILSIINLSKGNIQIATFLGFLSLLTAFPLWYAIAILKNKRSYSANYIRTERIFKGLLFFTGLLLIGYGIKVGAANGGILMIIFGAIAMPIGIGVFRGPQALEKTTWIQNHLQGMLITGIAAHTAFFAFGGRTILGDIFSGYWMIIPWVAPTVLGVIAIRVWKRRYQSKPTVNS